MGRCEVVPNADGGVTFFCRRGPVPMCWTCSKENRRRPAVAFCDGTPPPNVKRQTCDAGMCGQHRTKVGPDLDNCPGCVAKTAKPPEPPKPPERIQAVRPSLF